MTTILVHFNHLIENNLGNLFLKAFTVFFLLCRNKIAPQSTFTYPMWTSHCNTKLFLWHACLVLKKTFSAWCKQADKQTNKQIPLQLISQKNYCYENNNLYFFRTIFLSATVTERLSMKFLLSFFAKWFIQNFTLSGALCKISEFC